eukprot:TRINITY_DN20935_c0_g1_i2.p1 TRINITY_DN20935_c0_g1~~TRINITY_DN20935_c0_g1_i2.p1  ORF type:complete len:211 (+),score=19.55 TRINITY_DN20935_c0_g1_i2:65-634(+)
MCIRDRGQSPQTTKGPQISVQKILSTADLVAEDTENEIYIRRTRFKYDKRPDGHKYLGGKINGAEINQITQDIELLNDGFRVLKLAERLIIVAIASFVFFFINILYQAIRISDYKQLNLMFVVAPLLIFVIFFVASGLLMSIGSKRTTQRTKDYLVAINMSRLIQRDLIAGILVYGWIKISVLSWKTSK